MSVWGSRLCSLWTKGPVERVSVRQHATRGDVERIYDLGIAMFSEDESVDGCFCNLLERGRWFQAPKQEMQSFNQGLDIPCCTTRVRK